MSGHYRRLSLAQGASLCVVGILIGLSFLVVAARVRPLPGFLLLLGAWFCLWFFSHDLAHHIVGRIVGVGFRYYFLGRSSISKLRLPIISELSRNFLVLGLKIDTSRLRSISKRRLAAMYASGAVSSMFLPLLVLPTAYTVDILVGLLLTLLTGANILFTVYFSVRVGDLHRAWTVQDIYQ